MTAVLNPLLFSALRRRFGEVRIVNPGMQVLWELYRSRPGGPLMRRFLSDGEVYKVCCPRCGDRRWRLRFGHRFGMWDPQTRSYHWERVFCFNESCFASYEARRQLVWQLFCHAPPKFYRLPSAQEPPAVLSEVDWPGDMVSLCDLAAAMPGHQAIRYLQHRGFDLQELDEIWGVRVCLRARTGFRLMQDRITIPIFWEGRMVAWQGRYPGECDWRELRIPKYWTSPGVPKFRLVYNWDRARRGSLIVVVEGPTDAWRVGEAAVALLGKTLSSPVCGVLAEYLRRDPQNRIVVMLDPDQDTKSAICGQAHHQSVVLHRLARVAPDRVAPVWLSAGTDPGSLPRDEIWRRIGELDWSTLGRKEVTECR